MARADNSYALGFAGYYGIIDQISDNRLTPMALRRRSGDDGPAGETLRRAAFPDQ